MHDYKNNDSREHDRPLRFFFFTRVGDRALLIAEEKTFWSMRAKIITGGKIEARTCMEIYWDAKGERNFTLNFPAARLRYLSLSLFVLKSATRELRVAAER